MIIFSSWRGSIYKNRFAEPEPFDLDLWPWQGHCSQSLTVLYMYSKYEACKSNIIGDIANSLVFGNESHMDLPIRIQTCKLPVTSPTLYRLSYQGSSLNVSRLLKYDT